MLPSSSGILAQVAQDIRYGLRLLRKSPGFTAVTVLTLALGIGASTALFSVVDSLLLRPFPYPDSERLVVVWSKPPRGRVSNVSAANFLDFREQNRVFERMGAVMQAEFNVSIQGVAERLTGFRVSADFLETLGVRPALGRNFAAGDDRPGAPRVAILSHGAWQRRFGGDRRILGQALTVDGESCTIIGVTPASFRFAYAPEMLAPLALDSATASRDFHVLFAFAKLKRGIPSAQARTEMESIARNLERAYPKSLKGWSVDLWPWRQNFVGGESQRVLVLFGAVGFVLLIACVNLANLLLAKAAVRRRELAVRASLGAGPVRLVRQILTESVLLSAMGGIAGVLLARWLVPLIATLVAQPILAAIAEIGIDGRVLAFTLALSVLTGLLFGVAPAWRASKVDLHNELKGAGRGSTSISSGRCLRAALVVAELALSLMLLVGAGLMARSLAAMYSSDPGFRAENVLTMRLTMPEARYAEPAQVRAFDRMLLERVRALPGVRAATLASYMPLEGRAIPMRFQIASRPVPGAEQPNAGFQYTSAGYFETLGIALRKGRFFTERDNESAPRVAIVNEAFVHRYLAKEAPLGQRLLLDERWISGKQKPGPPLPWEIVGVIADVKIWGPHRSGRPQLYAPLMQCPRPGGVLAVRTEVGPLGMARTVRALVHELDKDVPVTDIKTMRQIAAASYAQPRSQAWIIGSFAAVALILAALGTYGVMSCLVAQSTHEMGIRMALGARPGDLLRMTLRKGVVIATIGLGLGLAGSLALTRMVQSLLYRVTPTDPLTYITVSMLLLAVAMLATYVPARRAARVDPSVALRWE